MATFIAICITMNASIAELKAHSPKIIKAVEGGEACTVTRRNEPVARIIRCEQLPENRTRAGFDTSVRLMGDVTTPALDASEWGNLSF